MANAAVHSTGFVQLVQDAKTRIKEIQPQELGEHLRKNPDAKLIDTREDNEFAAGHLKGAEHIGRGVIERDIEVKHPDRSTLLYLYCGGGSRSALAAENLQRMGYVNVINVDGGWRVLKDLLPVE